MSLQYDTDAELEEKHATCAKRAKELKGKQSPAARHEAQTNADYFTEITREIKRRQDNADT